jgi:DNA topoisomerase-1
VDKDLALPGLPREKILAAVVRLLETTMMRVGNEEYARSNGSFGLTTLRAKHVRVNGARLPISVPRQEWRAS